MFWLALDTITAPRTDRGVKPNIMYDVEHPVFPKLQQIGREITQKVKPAAVVVFRYGGIARFYSVRS